MQSHYENALICTMPQTSFMLVHIYLSLASDTTANWTVQFQSLACADAAASLLDLTLKQPRTAVSEL